MPRAVSTIRLKDISIVIKEGIVNWVSKLIRIYFGFALDWFSIAN